METTPFLILPCRDHWRRRLRGRSRATLFATLIGIVAQVPSAAVGAAFQGLGDLPGGAFKSEVYDMTPDGAFVVGLSGLDSVQEAFVWSATAAMIGLGDLSGGEFRSEAHGISADGSVIVGSSYSAIDPIYTQEAFRWTQATGMVGLGDLPGGISKSVATAVSADGTVIVGQGHYGAAEGRAFRWTEATGMVPLGFLGAVGNNAHGVSADGTVIVGDAGGEAFKWTESGGMIGLGDLPGGPFESEATGGVSADGTVVAGQSMSALGDEAAIWSQATGWIGLGDLPGGAYNIRAYDISADGKVVVGYGETGNDDDRAFVWDAMLGMRNVKQLLLASGIAEVANWKLYLANAVSADGRIIAGNGVNPDGNLEGWIAEVPELFPVGDYNDNGTVDAADYVLWRDQLGEVVPPCSGPDSDCDGFVGNSDYGTWKRNFGASLPNGAGGVAGISSSQPTEVPEPSTLLLIALGIAGLICRCRPRRHDCR